MLLIRLVVNVFELPGGLISGSSGSALKPLCQREIDAHLVEGADVFSALDFFQEDDSSRICTSQSQI